MLGVTDDEERRNLESQEMERFFFFESDPARLLGVPRDGSYESVTPPFAEDELREARLEIKLAASERQPERLPRMRAHLERALEKAFKVLDRFRDPAGAAPPAPFYRDVPVLQAAALKLAQAQAQMQLNDYGQVADALRAVLRDLEMAVSGNASVQMLYIIEGFYLFRLLVRYRIESDCPINNDAIAETSGELTKLLHNGQNGNGQNGNGQNGNGQNGNGQNGNGQNGNGQNGNGQNGEGRKWLTTFLRERIVKLSQAICRIDPAGHTRFFLKGGRALNYMLGTPELGENDWDTQILIDPNLPAKDWYAIFMKVHNEVLGQLKKFKMEFFMELHYNATNFYALLTQEADAQGRRRKANLQALPPAADDYPPPEPAAPELVAAMDVDDDPLARRYVKAVKAELIDVGIPRHDTVEAREQWSRLREAILKAEDCVPYPGPLYYILEYLLLVEESVSGDARTQQKSVKRIKRFLQILSVQSEKMEKEIKELRGRIEGVLPQSLQVANAKSLSIQRLLIVALAQFSLAYDLSASPACHIRPATRSCLHSPRSSMRSSRGASRR